MRVAINAEKVAGAVNTSNEHAIVTKVVADLYISRMQVATAKRPEVPVQ